MSRQSGAEHEIEVTEEMVKAGFGEMALWEPGKDPVETAYSILEGVFRAMWLARPKSDCPASTYCHRCAE